jgi:hypothetical protein
MILVPTMPLHFRNLTKITLSLIDQRFLASQEDWRLWFLITISEPAMKLAKNLVFSFDGEDVREEVSHFVER